ncbi:MAG: glycosyltransferase family 2 protein [Candidatus Bathyarchaeia archaeon]
MKFVFLASYLSLSFGCLFFIYAIKYYTSILLVLFRMDSSEAGEGRGYPDIVEEPFISIHLPFYNELNVAERIISACLDMDYDNYEVMILDDSRDPTTELLKERRWREGAGRIKVIHRGDRSGFKGGALSRALDYMHPETEYIIVLDADFVPPRDIIRRFLEVFGEVEDAAGKPIGVVQGYQLHCLNKAANWVTRAVRTEYSGSYRVERVAAEWYGGMKMISGSVFMLRSDVARRLGWSESITEDWELTLKLYLEGFRVKYTPFISAKAEIPTELGRLARQRMRWAEGHTYNVRRYFWRVLASPSLGVVEKLEFLYFAPYYLQSLFWILGTVFWVIAELSHRKPFFWSSALGWSLIICNLLALPLMSLAGLYLEGDLIEDFTGVFGFIAVSFLLTPYQAFAALKGLLEGEEGYWIRTLKTGSIAERVLRSGLMEFIRKLLGLRGRGGDRGSKSNGSGFATHLPWRGMIILLSVVMPALPFATGIYALLYGFRSLCTDSQVLTMGILDVGGFIAKILCFL